MKSLVLVILFCLINVDVSHGQAVYRGRSYSAPVCSNQNCAMCNAIRAQLVSQSQYAVQPQPQMQYTPQPQNIVQSQPQVQAQPKVVLKDLSLELLPTPYDAIDILVTLLRPTANDVFVEPGCGDGRILNAVGKFCPAFGIELNENTAKKAKKNAGKNVMVLVEDATQSDYRSATIVSMYLYPDLMEKIVPLLQPGTRIVSYCHPIPGVECVEYTSKGHTFYVGVK